MDEAHRGNSGGIYWRLDNPGESTLHTIGLGVAISGHDGLFALQCSNVVYVGCGAAYRFIDLCRSRTLLGHIRGL